MLRIRVVHADSRAPLPRRIHDLIHRGDLDGRYRSRSEALQAVLTAAVNARWSAEQAWAWITQPDHAARGWIHLRSNGRPLTDRQARARFDRAWDSARAFVAGNPPFADRTDAMLVIAATREDAEDARWQGAAGATDRAVLLDAIRTAERAGKTRFDYAVRDAVVGAGVSTGTASASLRRLCNRVPGLRCVVKGRGTRASTYELVPARAQAEHTDLARRARTEHTDLTESRVSVCSGDARDTFRWSGLGWSAGRVYDRLGAEPQDPKAIAEALGTSAGNLLRHLRRLKAFDLAARVLDGWVRGQADPEQAAVDLGTAGRGEIDRARVESDRRERSRWLLTRGADGREGGQDRA